MIKNQEIQTAIIAVIYEYICPYCEADHAEAAGEAKKFEKECDCCGDTFIAEV